MRTPSHITAVALLSTLCLLCVACSDDSTSTPDQGSGAADTSAPAADTGAPTPDTAVAPDTAAACDDNCDTACAGQIMCTPEAAPAQLPGQYPVGEFVIGGFEYWPWAETPPLYPDKIKWGYKAGTPAAQKCMAAAYRRLIRILENPPQELIDFKKKHGVYSFYNWNNDYTGAAGDDIAPAHEALALLAGDRDRLRAMAARAIGAARNRTWQSATEALARALATP